MRSLRIFNLGENNVNILMFIAYIMLLVLTWTLGYRVGSRK